MATFHVAVLLLFSCWTCINGVVKLPNGTLDFGTPDEVKVSSSLETDFDGKGLEPWYNLAKSFIHTVRSGGLPYDEFKKIKDGDFEAAEFLKGWELPILVTFAIGVLFAVVTPIVGLCFCCCRCCGNCGGEMSQKQTDHMKLKRRLFGLFLVIITFIMFTGCLLAFVSNDRITDTVDSFKSTPIAALDAANDYFNQTLNLVNEFVFDNVLEVLDIVVHDVAKLPDDISKSVKSELKTTVKEPLEKVVELGKRTEEMKVLLSRVKNNTEELQSRYKVLEQNITLCTACGLTTGANFSNLPDVTDQLNNVADVLNGDFVKNAEDGLKEFEDIDQKIKNETRDETDSINEEVEKARDKFKDEIKKDITDKLNEEVFDKTDEWKKDIEEYFDDYIKPNDKYRYYAGVGFICLVLLPVVLMALGLLCGIFGHDNDVGPTERGSIPHMGGNCLMAAVGFMFIFVFFLMLFISLFFFFGAHLELGCDAFRDDTFLKEYLDNPEYFDGKYILADAFFNDGNISLTVEGVLNSCRANEPLFKAIQGEKKWDIEDKFNVTKELGDFQKDIREFNVPINDQKILDNATLKGLEDLGNSGVDDIDFDAFFNETKKEIVPGLDEKINATSNATVVAKLRAIKTDADEMKILATELEKDVVELKRLGENLKNLSSETTNVAKEAEKNFKENANIVVKQTATDSANRIVGYVDQTAARSVSFIKDDLGRCAILSDIYDATVNLLCRETVFPFNGFWFAIGFSLFFYIPAIVLSVKLAKHYRRMTFEEGFDKHTGMEMRPVHEGNKPWLNQGNAVYPK